MTDTNYIGIDYGRGKTNIDPETGIRYGIINANDLMPEALDDFEPHYPADLTEEESEFFEATCATYEKDGYAMQHNYESNTVWVFKSPYITTCMFCSPCAPGAGDLNSPCENGIKTYCLGADWFEDEKAPYPMTSTQK